MKAVVYSAYGPPDGLHLTEVATPTSGRGTIGAGGHAVTLDVVRDDPTLVGAATLARLSLLRAR